ncbi:hypothetical protein RJ639_024686 [Escallonia herrerae]|uniref:non-specific serine/threonine protein kinase n=1 Tax=Escallonia herrerae TaxID=1293975 RepID=A0AA88V3A0_9ASTE|nr:hypothetical protein RJ639_024686 [Escallonia herrerae]
MLPLLLFLHLYLRIPPTSSLNQEGLYLQQVKLSLSDPSASLSDWNPRHDTPCNWTGITCDPLTHSVSSVILPSASLSGPFPAFFCRLPFLSALSLPNNSINSSLPPSVSACRSLTLLDLSENLLAGPIPRTLPDMPNLKHLNLDGNSLTGEIPESFGSFRGLETLGLAGNLLTGTVPGFLSNVTSLKSLQLAYNPFRPGRLAPRLGNLSNLETLWVSQCNLWGQIPETFSRLSRLTSLDVSNNRLNGSIPTLIFRLTSLVQIELFNNSFTGEIPAGWSNLTALRNFDASMNRLVGAIPDELCELPLASLFLYENELEGVLPDSIARSPNLFEMKLFTNRLTGSLPTDLGKNSPLQILDVSENQFSGKIPPNLCGKGALVELLLIYNTFSGEIPVSLGQCWSLSRVRMRSNRLSGKVPAGFWGLPHVSLLDLRENLFSGNISHIISGAFNLSTLSISQNRFSGVIPNEIGSLRNLIEFSASGNKLSGPFPDTLVHLGLLQKLDLSKNELSGRIPTGIKSLVQLNELNLADNRLSGEIPDEIGSLSVLNYLDLSENFFSGKIPLTLQNLKLNTLNLSSNDLTGGIPPNYAKEVYRDSFVGNSGLCDDLVGLCAQKIGDKSHLWILVSMFMLAGIVFVIGVVWFVLKCRNLKKTKKAAIMSKWRSFHKLGFSEFEILDCLSEDNIIGSGASGKVYKAVLSNGEVVAVKLFARSNTDGATSASISWDKNGFEIEVETLGKIRHKNIVRLWCCCNTETSKLLVYEYMPNGSLGDLLHSSKGGLLEWPTRFRIALDAAEGLSYLHHDCVPPIVHRDVKSNNILLDGEFGAKIADFGVAKIGDAVNQEADSMSVIAGSCGYIAPEYAYTLRVNEKSDIYSFGVVILELVTGRRPIDQDFGEKGLAAWVSTTLESKGREQVLDPHLDSTYREQIFRVLDIGLLCISPLPINRPSMRRVVKLLQEARVDNEPKTATNKDGKLSPYYYEDGSDQGSVV